MVLVWMVHTWSYVCSLSICHLTSSPSPSSVTPYTSVCNNHICVFPLPYTRHIAQVMITWASVCLPGSSVYTRSHSSMKLDYKFNISRFSPFHWYTRSQRFIKLDYMFNIPKFTTMCFLSLCNFRLCSYFFKIISHFFNNINFFIYKKVLYKNYYRVLN